MGHPRGDDLSGDGWAIACAGVSKSFPGVRALDDVSLGLRPGTVHALLGENGAGKSTLIRILTGAERPDTGQVFIGGQPLRHATPVAARKLGVRVLPQERHVAGELTVGHNVLLDDLPRNALGLVGARAIARRAQEHLDRLGLDLDARMRAGDLTAAQQQLVELARTTARPAQVIVLDEPTASLAGDEVEVLFRVIRSLREQGTTLLYISHHLHEVFEVADTATVLRNGRHVMDVAVADTDTDGLLRAMFDREIEHSRLPRAPRPAAPPAPVLTARGVAVPGRLAPLDVAVRPGEVLALSGPAGSGTSLLAELLAGVSQPGEGTVELAGTGRLRSRSAAASAGIGFVPADRKRQALLLERAIVENLQLGAAATSVLYRPRRALRDAARALQRGRVRAASPGTPVRVLSGGNQQRVVFARWLSAGCRVLVLDQPTAGVDVAAKFDIYAQLLDLTADGVAVVVVSSDYEEISALADRALIMVGGVATASLDGDAITPEKLYELETEGAHEVGEAVVLPPEEDR
ncbi:sugar ABC transporter ATP-binding protein [Trujillonella humicola]|uniref:sugar ABC transporter ATP-binding protein n=1 Tax=Trujillonella humicola TaxID=3383699 RepID=UPI003906439C